MRNRMLFVLGCLMLCLTIPALAQLSDDGTTFTFENGLEVSIPDGWSVADQDNEERDFVALDDGRTGVTLLLYYPQTLQDNNAETAAEAIAAHYSTVLNSEIDDRDVEDVTLEGIDGGRILTTVATDSDEYEQVAYGFILSDGYALLGLIYPMKGSGLRSTSEDDALPIIEGVLQGVDGQSSDNGNDNGDDNGDNGPDITIPDIGPGNNDDADENSDDGIAEFGYMTTLTVPEGWTLEESDSSFARLSDDESKIEISFYTPHRAGLKGRDAEDLLLDYFATVNNAENNEIDPDDIEITDIAGLDAARYETDYSPEEGTEYELTVVSFILPNEAGIVAAIYPANGTRLESQFNALSVIEEFAAAQPAATESIDLGYNVVFDVPRGWAVYSLNDDSVDLDNGATSLGVKSYYPSTVEEQNLGSAEDVLTYYMEERYPDTTFRVRDAEELDLGRLDGISYRYEVETDTATYPRTIVATLLRDETRAVVGDIIPVQGERLVGEEETIALFEDIANSIEDMPEEFEFTDGSVFEFPRGWYYYSSTDDYFVNMDDNVTGLLLDMYSPDEMEGNASDAEELLEWYRDESVGGSELEEVEVGGVEGLRFETTSTNDSGEEYDRIQYSFILPNDYGLIVSIYPLYGNDYNERDALPLLESFLEQDR